MTRRIHHSPGFISWVDYAAHDGKKARRFYGELFGWKAVDFDKSGQSAIFKLEGEPVAGLGVIGPQMQAKYPPTWNTYVAVNDVNETAGWVKGAGGAVVMEATPVGTAGSMGVFTDRSGASFAVWCAGDHMGAGLVDEPGAKGWHELRCADFKQAEAFYAEVFGWSFSDGRVRGTREVHTEGELIGVLAPPPSPLRGPAWLPSLVVEKLEPALLKVKALGGELVSPPQKFALGQSAIVADDQGGVVGLVFLEEQD